MADKELKKIYGNKWAKEQRKKDKAERKKQRVLNAKNRESIKNNISGGLNILSLIISIMLIITVIRILFGSSETYFSFGALLEELINFKGVDISILFGDWNVSPSLPDWLEGIANFFTTIAQIVAVIGGLIINAITFIVHVLGIVFGVG